MGNHQTAIIPRRHIKLTKRERDDLAERQQLELLVSMFLDLEQDRTNKQIAEEMGLSLPAMKRLTEKPEFQAIYDDQLMKLGHHPRLQALNANLPELAVHSYNALRQILTNPRASATARVAAAKLVWDTLHIADTRLEEDPAPLSNFLKSAGVNVEGNAIVNVNLPIPDDYKAAFARLMGSEVIDVVAQPVNSPTPESPDEE